MEIKRRLSELTDEEAAAEARLIKAELDEAQREAAPLLLLQWSEQDQEDLL